MVRYNLFIINNDSGAHGQRANIDDEERELPRIGEIYSIRSPIDMATYRVKSVCHPAQLIAVESDDKTLKLTPLVPEVTIERLVLSDI
ncbi:hypothetical protein KW787_02275 [Candidatus Pacearchaeota archaeon]|nr:hypothetical protein [Candidatus Pacearchaeota archaeon]